MDAYVYARRASFTSTRTVRTWTLHERARILLILAAGRRARALMHGVTNERYGDRCYSPIARLVLPRVRGFAMLVRSVRLINWRGALGGRRASTVPCLARWRAPSGNAVERVQHQLHHGGCSG